MNAFSKTTHAAAGVHYMSKTFAALHNSCVTLLEAELQTTSGVHTAKMVQKVMASRYCHVSVLRVDLDQSIQHD